MKKLLNEKKLSYYLTYSLAFIVLSLIVFSYFYLNDKTFINKANDGLVQHYKALVYYSEYLRSIFRSLISQHKPIIPQWDFSIGEGADILQTLHMYAIGDPLSFFAVFFPREKIYIWYDISILIRLYLSGLFFTCLCLYTGLKNKYAILSGSLVYVFCFWDLLNVLEHIYWLNPMLYLPLIVIGVEKIINNEKPYLLCISVFIAALSNFYFFYMLVLLTVIYVAVRLLFAYGKNLKELLSKLLKIFVFSLLGTLMAAVILFPVLGAFISDSRVSADSVNNLFYGKLYYERLFAVFVSDDFEYDLCMGYACPVLLALGLLLKDKTKKGRMLLCINIIVALMVCLPIFGKIMNGFAYPINRWSFAIALAVAYSFVFEWEEIENNRLYLLIFMGIVFSFAMLSTWSRSIRVIIPIVICLTFYLVSQLKIEKQIKGFEVKQLLMVVLVILNIIYVADYDFSPRGTNRIEDSASRQEAINALAYSDASIFRNYLEENNEKDFVRYGGNSLNINAAMLEDVNSVDFYWSVTNPSVISFREKLGINDFTSYMYRGYDDRAALCSLANVKYYLNYDEKLYPYGFDYLKDKSDISFYENKYDLPFGYTYKDSISYEKWNEFDQIEKQMSILNVIVTEKGNDNYVPENNRLSFEISPEEGITIEDGKIISTKEKAVVHLLFQKPESGEYDLSFSGLNFIDTEGYIEGNRTWVRIKVIGNDEEKSIYYFTPEYQFYSGRHDFTVSYGNQEKGLEEITLILPYPGIYTFDDLYVNCISYGSYRQSIDNLKEDSLQNVVFENNSVSGTIDLKEKKFILFSIPYAKGWKAFVDGEEVELLRANECYMAIEAEKGTHDIKLVYHTPLSTFGLCTSLFTCVIFGLICYLDKKGKITL